MSTSRALCCLPLVKKQKHDFYFLSVQCIIKQLLDFEHGDSVFVIGLGEGYQPQPSASADNPYLGFCDIQNNRGLGEGYQPQPSASADNPYLVLDYSGYHKNLIQ